MRRTWGAKWIVALQAMVVASGVVAAAYGGERLPLGDGKTSDAPRRGYVFACNRFFPGGGGAHRVGEWIRDGFWFPDEKPHVEGSVAWPGAAVRITREGARRIVRANALPTHATGEYPIRPGTRTSTTATPTRSANRRWCSTSPRSRPSRRRPRACRWG